MRQKIWLIAGLFLSFCLFAGCGDKSDNNKDTEVTQTLEEIYTQMEENVELSPMLKLEDDYITNYYGVDLATFDEYVFMTAENALLAETIIMVKMKDGESSESIVKLLENIIQQKKTELENYLPEQFKIVEKSEVTTNGNYVILIISSKKAELEEQLPEALRP